MTQEEQLMQNILAHTRGVMKYLQSEAKQETRQQDMELLDRLEKKKRNEKKIKQTPVATPLSPPVSAIPVLQNAIPDGSEVFATPKKSYLGVPKMGSEFNGVVTTLESGVDSIDGVSTSALVSKNVSDSRKEPKSKEPKTTKAKL